MGNDMVWKHLSQFPLKSYDPSLSCASLHSNIIFPINIDPIQIVLSYQSTQFHSTVHSIELLSCGELCCSEGTNHYLFSSRVILGLQILLNAVFSSSERTLRAEIFQGIDPNIDDVQGTGLATPKGENNIVILSIDCVSGYTYGLGNFLWRPPLSDFIDVCGSNGSD